MVVAKTNNDEDWERANQLAANRRYSRSFQEMLDKSAPLSPMLAKKLSRLKGDCQSRFVQAAQMLISAVSDRDRKVGCAAVQILGLREAHIGSTASAFPSTMSTQIVKALLAPVGGSNRDLHSPALSSLGSFAEQFPNQIVNKLCNSFPTATVDTVLAGLQLMQACGPDAASGALPLVTRFLRHDNGEVRCETCRFLQFLAEDAVQYVPDLIKVAVHDNAEDVQVVAVTALITIDPSGALLQNGLHTSDERSAFIDLLRQRGEKGRKLRRCLESAWLTSAGDEDARESKEQDPVPKKRERRAFDRDQWFLSQYDANDTETSGRPATIRDKWNHMRDADRQAIAPNCWQTISTGKDGIGVVKKALAKARLEKKR